MFDYSGVTLVFFSFFFLLHYFPLCSDSYFLVTKDLKDRFPEDPNLPKWCLIRIVDENFAFEYYTHAHYSETVKKLKNKEEWEMFKKLSKFGGLFQINKSKFDELLQKPDPVRETFYTVSRILHFTKCILKIFIHSQIVYTCLFWWSFFG